MFGFRKPKPVAVTVARSVKVYPVAKRVQSPWVQRNGRNEQHAHETVKR